MSFPQIEHAGRLNAILMEVSGYTPPSMLATAGCNSALALVAAAPVLSPDAVTAALGLDEPSHPARIAPAVAASALRRA